MKIISVLFVFMLLALTVSVSATEEFDRDKTFKYDIGELTETRKTIGDVGFILNLNTVSYAIGDNLSSSTSTARSYLWEIGVRLYSFNYEVIDNSDYNSKVASKLTVDTHNQNHYAENGADTVSKVTTDISFGQFDLLLGDVESKLWFVGNTFDNTNRFSSCGYVMVEDDIYNKGGQLIESRLFMYPIRQQYDETGADPYSYNEGEMNIFIPFYHNAFERHEFKFKTFKIIENVDMKTYETVVKSWWDFPLINSITNDKHKICTTTDTSIVNRDFVGFELEDNYIETIEFIGVT